MLRTTSLLFTTWDTSRSPCRQSNFRPQWPPNSGTIAWRRYPGISLRAYFAHAFPSALPIRSGIRHFMRRQYGPRYQSDSNLLLVVVQSSWSRRESWRVPSKRDLTCLIPCLPWHRLRSGSSMPLPLDRSEIRRVTHPSDGLMNSANPG